MKEYFILTRDVKNYKISLSFNQYSTQFINFHSFMYEKVKRQQHS